MITNIPIIRPFGVDIFCLGRKFLVYNMVNRNLKIKYRRSIFGLFWTLLSPIAMAMVYYFVFKLILKIQIPHYLVFIISGVLPWSFFSQSLIEGMESISGSWGLLTKVPIPAQLFPLISVLTNLSTLILSVPVLICAAFISGVHLGPSLIWLPFFFIALFLLAYFFSLVLGLLFVTFKDLRHLMNIVLQLWFYATPVFYEESMIPSQFRWMLNLNPVAGIFSGIHRILVQGTWPTYREISSVSIWVAVAFVFGSFFQKYAGHELVENL